MTCMLRCELKGVSSLLPRELGLLQQLGYGVPAVAPSLQPADQPPAPRVSWQRSAQLQLLARRVQQMRLRGCICSLAVKQRAYE